MQQSVDQNEATCGIHECDAVEVAFKHSANRRLVQLEREPGFVDRKLGGMKQRDAAL
jgi:hypothetical protein